MQATRNNIMAILPPPKYRAKLLSGWQNTDDIILAITEQHRDNLAAAKKIKHLFCAGNETTTARNIFNFLKNEITYKIESGDKQTTKSLSRFIADGEGDCKHFSLFANTILASCGYKVYYRFAGYKDKISLQHVYSYLPKTNIVLDAVMPSFDTEKTPKAKKDYYMSLYKLSGLEEDEVSGISFDKIKSNVNAATKKASPAIKKVIAQMPDATKKLAQGTKTVSLAIPRSAFIALTALNVHDIATSLKALMAKKGDMEALKWWVDMGGNRTALIKAINDGAKKKSILGINEENAAYNEVYGGYSGEVADNIGVVATTAAASAATAAPILLKLKETLAKAGINSKKITDAAAKAKGSFESLTGKKLTDVLFKKDAGLTSDADELSADDLKDTTEADAKKVVDAAIKGATGLNAAQLEAAKKDSEKSDNKGGGIMSMLKNKKVLIGGAIGLGIMAFLFSKKK